MIDVILENQYGEQLRLTCNESYDLLQVTGLTPPAATINVSTLATKDGGVFNSSRLNVRNMTLLIAPGPSLERNRVELYRYIRSKQYVKLYLKTNLRDVWIDGYVETVEGDLFENPQRLQVSIICPDPYFKALDNSVTDFSNVNAAFTFAFSPTAEGQVVSTLSQFSEVNVHNDSDDETGVIIELQARGTVLEPTIYNQTTGEQFTIQYEMQEGDKIILNTRKGEKSLTLIHEGVQSNIINNMVRGGDWFKLKMGDNIFTYSCAHGASDLQLSIIVQPIFAGV